MSDNYDPIRCEMLQMENDNLKQEVARLKQVIEMFENDDIHKGLLEQNARLKSKLDNISKYMRNFNFEKYVNLTSEIMEELIK